MEIKNEKHVILENNQQEDSIFHQVDELIGENKLDDALLLLDLIPEGSPNFANALFARSMILTFLDLHDESMETLNDSLTTQFSENQPFDPNDPEDLFDMGITNFYFSEYEKAIRNFDKSLEILPDQSEVIYYKALSLGCMGEYEKAIRVIDRAIELKPENNNY